MSVDQDVARPGLVQAYAPTPADVDYLACELESAVTVVVIPPRPPAADELGVVS